MLGNMIGGKIEIDWELLLGEPIEMLKRPIGKSGTSAYMRIPSEHLGKMAKVTLDKYNIVMRKVIHRGNNFMISIPKKLYEKYKNKKFKVEIFENIFNQNVGGIDIKID